MPSDLLISRPLALRPPPLGPILQVVTDLVRWQYEIRVFSSQERVTLLSYSPIRTDCLRCRVNSHEFLGRWVAAGRVDDTPGGRSMSSTIRLASLLFSMNFLSVPNMSSWFNHYVPLIKCLGPWSPSRSQKSPNSIMNWPWRRGASSNWTWRYSSPFFSEFIRLFPANVKRYEEGCNVQWHPRKSYLSFFLESTVFSQQNG